MMVFCLVKVGENKWSGSKKNGVCVIEFAVKLIYRVSNREKSKLPSVVSGHILLTAMRN